MTSTDKTPFLAIECSDPSAQAELEEITQRVARLAARDLLTKNSSFKQHEVKAAVEETMKGLFTSTVNTLLAAEMNLHLGTVPYGRLHQDKASTSTASDSDSPSETSAEAATSEEEMQSNERNYRNGYYTRKLETPFGPTTIKMPRDRAGTFNPVTVPKNGSSLDEALRDKILFTIASGNSVRDTANLISEILKVDVSSGFVQDVVASYEEEYDRWCNRQLDEFYPFVFVDCLYTDSRDEIGRALNKPVYAMLGITTDGRRDLLDITMSEKTSGESKSFWLSRFDNIKQRGVKDLMFVSIDGVSGLENGLHALFPDATVQRCVVHLLRNSNELIGKKDRYKWCSSFKSLYTALDKEGAWEAFEQLKLEWAGDNYIAAVNFVKRHFESHILPLYDLPYDIRKIVYTTNSIEAVNSSFRKVTKKGIFGSEKAACTRMYMRYHFILAPKWDSRPIANWHKVKSQLLICEKTRDMMAKYVPHLVQ